MFEFQYKTGFQKLVELCNRIGLRASFCLTADNRFCTVVNDRITVVNEGNGVRVRCPKATPRDRQIVDYVGSTVQRLAELGYAFPV